MHQPHNINQLLHWQPNTQLANLPPVDEQDLRIGMRNLAAPVSIITTINQSITAGLTATAVTSVTAEPPRLIAFINKNLYAAAQIFESGLLCINTLTAQQKELAYIFAGMNKDVPGEKRFNHGDWHTLATGAPVLKGAKVNFDCRVIKVFDESTHHAFLCEVLAVESCTEKPALLFMDGAFHALENQ